MTSAATMGSGAGAGAGTRPGANWAGWLGYAPTARGPEARRARAEAAGLIEPLALVAEPAVDIASAVPAAPSVQPRRRRATAPALRRRRPCATNDAEALSAAGRR